ncbi:DNA polymerase III subunit alpha [Rhodocaloribacter sp.]
MCEFSHLHCHTQYSLLDGAARIKTLLGKAAALEMPAVAITDHGNLFGVPEFYTTAKKNGIQPIIGCEFYVTPKGMGDKSDRTRYHQVLLARNLTGYRNLIRLSSLSYTDGYYYKPRIDKETLRRHSEGLIATTCCLQGEVLQTILKRGEDAARAVFEEYLDIFGEDYYIELQDHGIEDQKRCNAVLIRWAKEYGVKVVATNDVHYVDEDDAAAQDVLLCLQTGKDYYDPNRMRFDGTQFYLKSAGEMEAALGDLERDVVTRALVTTNEIAGKCSLELPMGELLMPHYPIPEAFGNDMDAYLRHLVFERARQRYPEMPQHVVERLEYELGIIRKMGYAGYFLIVQDFTTAARELGVSVGPGRGSAAGSAVAYCLGITNIDPLKYDLLFERFLNPERVSMPDIDIDFDDRGRGKVIDYVVQKYGRESVCQIITFGTMGARSVIRDVARVLSIPLSEADRIAKLIPEGPKVNLETAMKEVPEFRRLQEHADPQIRKLIHYAKVLEGSARHTGVHAAGVIIAPGKVSDYVPISIARGKSGAEDVVTTQYDGKWVESFGLLKMDFLGLKTLTVLDDALALIRENHGVEIDLDAIPLDDAKTFELFQRGDTVAIFQFESSGMREWLRKLRPTSVDDLIAMNALYRPGPMDLIPNYIARKHGREKVEYPHPMLEEILKPTYGIPVYQEQVMQMAQVMAGYSLGGADLLRRAMGKKDEKKMREQRVIFVEGAKERGVPEKTAHEVFDIMAKFAGYGFNKCVAGETEILDAATGRRTTVEDLFRTRASFTIHALDENARLRPRRVTDVVWNGRRPVFELRTALGKRIVATGNHPFRTLNGWTHLADLKPGDRIAAPRRLPVATRASWPRHALITLAHLLAEGNTCHPTCLYFYSNDREQVEDFARHVERFPNTVARLDRRADGRFEVCVSTGRDTRFRAGQIPWNKGGVKVRPKAPARSGAFRWAERLGITGKKAAEKSIPAEVFTLCDDDVALFLGRLWSGDGFVAGEGRFTPYYATSSERLARDVQTLLLRLGIVSTLHRKTFRYRGTTRTGWTVHPVGEGVLPAFLERIAPHLVGRDEQVARLRRHVASTARGQTSKDTIPAGVRAWVDAERRAAGLTWRALEARSGVAMKEFQGRGSKGKKGFRRSTLARLAAFFGSARLHAVAHTDVFWDTIESITPLGVQDTYDLTVEADHNFVADGLIVHNSHSAAYSIVAYQTAYLKAHYPPEFMAAAMTNEMGDTKKLAVVLEEARHLGIEMLPPSVNHSQAHFTVEDGKIRFGLGAIKGVGLGAIEAILNVREKHGPFTTLFGFTKRLDLRAVNKKAVESLARAGALDDLEGHRAQLVEAVDAAMQYAQKVQADLAAGQNSLFGGGATGGLAMEPNLPVAEPWPRAKILKEEREVIGFYVSGHPLEAYAAEARAFASARIGRIDELGLADAEEHGSNGRNGHYGRDARPRHSFCGIITDVQHRTTKAGKPFAFAAFEDFTGQAELVCFSRQYDLFQQYLKVDEVVLVRGHVELRGGSVKILVNEITPMWKVREQLVKAIVLRVNVDRVEIEQIEQLRDLCDANRGGCKLYFEVEADDLPHPQRIHSRTYVVEPTPELMHGMTRLFGPENVMLEGEA